MSEKINSFEDWVKNEPFCNTYYPSLAWNAACKMKDEEIERLKEELKDARSAYDHLSSEYRNLNKSWGDYKKENEELKNKSQN